MEWIKAHGFDPRGVWTAAIGPAGAVAEGVCAFAQQIADLPKAHPDAAVIFTTACDQMRRAPDLLERSRLDRVFVMNVPHTWQTTAAFRLYVER